MPETKPLSDNQASNRMRAALDALGDAPGETTAANSALRVCRMVLLQFYFGLIKSGENRDELHDPPYPPPKRPTDNGNCRKS